MNLIRSRCVLIRHIYQKLLRGSLPEKFVFLVPAGARLLRTWRLQSHPCQRLSKAPDLHGLEPGRLLLEGGEWHRWTWQLGWRPDSPHLLHYNHQGQGSRCHYLVFDSSGYYLNSILFTFKDRLKTCVFNKRTIKVCVRSCWQHPGTFVTSMQLLTV